MIRTIRINRKKWLRGGGFSIPSCLWDSEVKQGCCLGHAIRQSQRCAWDDLSGSHTPEDFLKKKDVLGLVDCEMILEGWPWEKKAYRYITDSEFSEKAMEINDAGYITDRQREKRLTKLFKKNKIKLVFYN